MIVQTRGIGRRKPLFEDFSVPPPAGTADEGKPLRLRDLIESVVRQQVELFRQRQARGRLDRVLSQKQIEAGAAAGRVAPEGREIRQEVDPDQAVQAALEAFEDGLYLVVIDGVEQRNLDALVQITNETRLTFIRLTFLAGA